MLIWNASYKYKCTKRYIFLHKNHKHNLFHAWKMVFFASLSFCLHESYHISWFSYNKYLAGFMCHLVAVNLKYINNQISKRDMFFFLFFFKRTLCALSNLCCLLIIYLIFQLKLLSMVHTVSIFAVHCLLFIHILYLNWSCSVRRRIRTEMLFIVHSL